MRFRYRQSYLRRLLPASDYCRTRGNQIVEYSSDNEKELGSSRKLGEAAESLIGGRENVFQSGVYLTRDTRVKYTYCRFSHDVTKIQTTKLLILLIFYFNEV